jgi:hypothetical protein
MSSSDYLDNTPERGGKLDVIVTRAPSLVSSGFIVVLFWYSLFWPAHWASADARGAWSGELKVELLPLTMELGLAVKLTV